MAKLDDYYNKFNEETRLNSRHGKVEFIISMEWIHKFLPTSPEEKACFQILDIGAGTGRYSVPLSEEGFPVTAIEPVNYNLSRIKAKNSSVNALHGNALRLKKIPDNFSDLTIFFGPMYHLLTREEKIQALTEAKRVTKPNGLIFVAYCMNEYSFITYGIKERHVLEAQENGLIDDNFHVIPGKDDLYSYLRIEDINSINEEVGLHRLHVISPDGPANYIRPFLNKLNDEEFEQFIAYQSSVCERPDLIGAGAHIVDILQKKQS